MPAAKTQPKDDIDQQRAELRERYPDSWIPVEAGDELSGEVVEVSRFWSDMRNAQTGDGWYPVLRIKQTDGGALLSFHAMQTVAYNQVMENQPRPGETVTISYQGVSGKAKPGQNAPHLFHVRVHGRDPREAASAVYGSLQPARGGRPLQFGNNDNTGANESEAPDKFDF